MPKTGARKHFQHNIEDDGEFTAMYWSMSPEERRAFNAEVDSQIDEEARDRRIDIEVDGPAAIEGFERDEKNGIQPERHGDGSGVGVKRSNDATEKQIAFMMTLYRELKPRIPSLVEPDVRTKKEASAAIDLFLALKKSLPAEPKPERKPPVERQDPPEGFHKVGETIYKVQSNRSGSHLYAKKLEVVDDLGEFVYVGRQPFRSLSDETLLTLEQAKEFGHLYGICCCCAAKLTDEHSIEAGIGPICAKKF